MKWRKSRLNQIQHNKIKGVLYGVAVGDALGAPVEFMSADAIRETYGRIKEMVGGGWLSVEPGEITDDTQMTLCVARGILKAPEDPVSEIGKQFIAWAQNDPKDIGGTCALSIGKAQTQANASGHSDTPTHSDWIEGSKETSRQLYGRSAGNGSLMRTAFVPCYYSDDETIRKRAVEISTMTHYSDEAAQACDLYCSIIGKIIGKRDYAARWSVFEREVRKTEYKRALEYGFVPKPTGYVKDSLLAAIWSIAQASRITTDFREAVETAVNLGGDADTIGAITGGLAGALCGFNHIPQSWVDALNESVRKELDELAYCAEIERERAQLERN